MIGSSCDAPGASCDEEACEDDRARCDGIEDERALGVAGGWLEANAGSGSLRRATLLPDRPLPQPEDAALFRRNIDGE